MDNFDLKKFLIENRLNSKSNLNEGAPGKYSMDNINVDLMNPSGDFIHMDDLNRKIRIQFGMGDKRMVLPTPPSLRNLTPMYQNIPKLEREVWEAITNEFRKLDEKLPEIVQNVINNYDPSLNEVTTQSRLNEKTDKSSFQKELDDEVKNVIDLFNKDLKDGQIKGTKDIDGYVNKIDSKLNSVLKYFKGTDEALESLNKYAEKIYNKAYDYFYDTIEKRDFPEKSTKNSQISENNENSRTFKIKIINKNGPSTIQHLQVNPKTTELFDIIHLIKKSPRVKDVEILEYEPSNDLLKKISEVNLLKKPFPGSTPKYNKFKLEWEIPGEEYSSLVVSNLKSINDVIDEKGIKKYKVLGWDGTKWKTIINYIN